MANLTVHPAPGHKGRLGQLLPGWFVVPQNPVRDGNQVLYVPRIGEILPGRFNTRANPLIEQVRAGLRGCSAASPGPMRFEGGLVSAPETEGQGDGEVPLWMHIAMGGLAVALVTGWVLKGGRR